MRDGDRPMLADEHGQWLRGDILGLLCAKALRIDALAIPVSCNTAVELSQQFKFVMRTKIGSPYVISAFAVLQHDYDTYAGFEANGGFLLGFDVTFNQENLIALPTRDAILPVLMVLFSARQSSVSLLTINLPKRFTHSDRLTNFAVVKSKQIIQLGAKYPKKLLTYLGLTFSDTIIVNTIDGLRFTLDNGDIVHLRPSGNAPEFRCYVESDSLFHAKQCVEAVLGRLSVINTDNILGELNG
jgi:phosphomannomutase